MQVAAPRLRGLVAGEQATDPEEDVKLEARDDDEEKPDGRRVDPSVEERCDRLGIRAAHDHERKERDGRNGKEKARSDPLRAEDLADEAALECLSRVLDAHARREDRGGAASTSGLPAGERLQAVTGLPLVATACSARSTRSTSVPSAMAAFVSASPPMRTPRTKTCGNVGQPLQSLIARRFFHSEK